MQIIIKQKLDRELILPISYHYVLQGIIYNALKKDVKYSSIIHSEEQETYKPFCFSDIEGKYRTEDKTIIFTDSIKWEIRSLDLYFINCLYNYFKNNNISYNNQTFENINLEIREDTVESDEIMIRMLTPIVVYETTDKHRKYFDPLENEFYQCVINNFYNKYKKYYKNDVNDVSIVFESISISKKDKVVTKYKDIYITGWKGIYKIKGPRKYLDFLFQSGLGSLNSQGFGLFEIIE